MLFISTWEKSYEGIYHSPPHVSVITGNILIMMTRFAHYYLLLASNSTLMTDSQYFDTIQIWRKLYETLQQFNLTKFVIFQIDTNHSPFML